jgi:hypothetical protein
MVSLLISGEIQAQSILTPLAMQRLVNVLRERPEGREQQHMLVDTGVNMEQSALKRVVVTTVGIVIARVVAEFVVQELRKHSVLDKTK